MNEKLLYVVDIILVYAVFFSLVQIPKLKKIDVMSLWKINK